jgi:ATP-binding cassette subfamily F protein 3
MTMHITNGTVRIYHGNFDAFLMQKEERANQESKEKENLRKKQDHMWAFVDRFRYKATKARQAQSRLKMIDRLQKIEKTLCVDMEEKKTLFKIQIDQISSKIVLNIENASIGYNGKVLNKNIDLKIIRGQKIAIIGPNGIGKSTLLKSIVKEIPFICGECTIGANVFSGYHSQESLDTLNPNLSVLENVVRCSPNVTNQQARTLLGNLLFTRDDVDKKVKVLSGGEKSKVSLAVILVQKNNFLILDEPTNHLDMSSTETLSQALFDYKGTVLVVSHNRAFINSFASHIFIMDWGKQAQLISGSIFLFYTLCVFTIF